MTASLDLFGMSHRPTSDEVTTLRKRELRNLLTSYADDADIFVEVIQNAFDAIVAAKAANMYAGEGGPHITIVIGKRAGGDPHYLLVSDNGAGMSPDVAGNFTTPGFTAGKTLGKTVGYKGVGASFFFAAANKIAFTTTDQAGRKTEATVTGAYSWIMSNHEPLPQTTNSMTCPESVVDALPPGRGTAVYYEFHPALKPKTLSHLVLTADDPAKDARSWACFLGSKTALGQVTDSSGLGIKVSLWLDDGVAVHMSDWQLGVFDPDSLALGYPYPWRVFKVHKDILEIQATPESQRVWTHKAKYQALHLRWDKQAVLGLTPALDLSPEETELLEAHFEFLDVFFAYSTEVLGEVHRRSGARARILRYGIRLAVDGVPQGRMVDFDLTSNQGLSRQVHAVMAFRNLELDTGRKIPANETVGELVRKLSVRAMTLLAEYRWAMKTKERPEPSVDLETWRNSVKERATNSIVRHLFEKLGLTSPLSVDPDTENDVIALYSVLIAQGILKGQQLIALSGFNRYDGLVNIDTNTVAVKDHADPLSVRDFSIDRDGTLKVLEFKLQFESLLEDFESRDKRPQDIDVAICWTLPELNVQRGSIQYTYGDRNDYRQLYGMTHLWRDENDTSRIPIVSLKHLIAEKLKLLEAGAPSVGTARFNDLLDADRNASI